MGPLISRDFPHVLLWTRKPFPRTAPAPIPLFPFSPSTSTTRVPAGHSAFQNQSGWAHRWRGPECSPGPSGCLGLGKPLWSNVPTFQGLPALAQLSLAFEKKLKPRARWGGMAPNPALLLRTSGEHQDASCGVRRPTVFQAQSGCAALSRHTSE